MNIQNDLKYWLSDVADIFDDFKDYVLDVDNIEKRRIFIDNDSDILFVAHLDTVQTPKFIKRSKKRIYAQGLDDRLGCMTAYELSQELKADLLLTDHEESIRSTAEFHTCKDYNWIVEFDREGNDVVTYDCDSVEFLDELEKYFIVGFGSFSDIAILSTDACCFNLGLGHKKSHSKDSYVHLHTYKQQVQRFRQFYTRYKDTKFIRDAKQYDDYYTGYGHTNIGACDICGFADGVRIFGHVLCEECLDYMVDTCKVF